MLKKLAMLFCVRPYKMMDSYIEAVEVNVLQD